MSFLLNGKPVDALALVIHRSVQETVGRQWVKKLRMSFVPPSPTAIEIVGLDKVIPRQLYEVPIQAAIGKRVIARETLKAMRADVTAGLYGGKREKLAMSDLVDPLNRTL